MPLPCLADSENFNAHVASSETADQPHAEGQMDGMAGRALQGKFSFRAALDSLQTGCLAQANLQAQQAALKARLQQALQITTLPKTNVDTATVADKAVHLLDMMIEVHCLCCLSFCRVDIKVTDKMFHGIGSVCLARHRVYGISIHTCRCTVCTRIHVLDPDAVSALAIARNQKLPACWDPGVWADMAPVIWMLNKMGRQGGVPELEEMVAVRNAMVRETDLRQPMDLGQQLLHSSGLADDVGQAMVDLLQVPTTSRSRGKF